MGNFIGEIKEKAGMARKIMAEIDSFKEEFAKKNPKIAHRWWMEFFNNFILQLVGHTRKLAEELGQKDIFDSVLFGNDFCYDQSEKKSQMTCGQFYDDIAQTVLDFDYKPEQLLALFEKARKPLPRFLRPVEMHYINKWLGVCFPLYLALRSKGYSHYDLII